MREASEREIKRLTLLDFLKNQPKPQLAEARSMMCSSANKNVHWNYGQDSFLIESATLAWDMSRM
jgi:hypothetical protein